MQEVNVIAVANRAVERRRDEQIMFLVAGSHTKEQRIGTVPAKPVPVSEPSSVTSAAPPAVTVPATSSAGEGVPCGGDLPPCYVVERESHGTWDAYNPTGCGGTGCYGPYQFGGFWAGKLGLPADLSTTTHDQWVSAARQLWNNGAGCSNWSACG